MARKNLLRDLMNTPKAPAPEPDASSPAADAAPQGRTRYTKGAIGAVGQSIADLKSRSISEIDPFLIDRGGVVDRLDEDAADHQALMDSIRDHGQQVPVLVRPHPDNDGRFQIVYGRRRVLALRDLGLPVKAMIRDLDDRELVLAQGQENTARKDLSFIEKANFARQMRDAGYDRKVICDALHVDKTQISRMLSIADAVGPDLISVIGAAPGIGRNRWLALADLMTASGTPAETAIALANLADVSTSDERFEALMKALTLPKRREKKIVEELVLRDDAGAEIGRMVRKSGRLTLTIPLAEAEGFDDWLAASFTEIHRNWLKSRGNNGR
ncbi:plasmid partitioning protein RepB [Tropicimonas sp. IMCC34043]|uniref:plasmid partitioning protein RepB n=1 Tax=Tropicimonas sp. IMCC34043 TaxID=2248760 RepID=UPI000E232A2A|nr:plasmid partitioning protein RepB [Tropicimonas sp. IMCC34043]